MKKKQLTDDQICKLVMKIAKPVFRKLRDNADNEFKKMNNMESIGFDDYINIMIGVARSIDINMINMISEICFMQTEHNLDKRKLLECHIDNLRHDFELMLEKQKTIN